MARNRDPYMNFLPDENLYNLRLLSYHKMQLTVDRIGYANGEMVEGGMQLPPEAEKFLRQEYQKYVAQGGDIILSRI